MFKRRLNPCMHCGGQAYLMRRNGKLNYRCGNKDCPERMITDDYPDTEVGKVEAMNEWNLHNPVPTTLELNGGLEKLKGQIVHCVYGSYYVSLSIAGELIYRCDFCRWEISGVEGCCIMFVANMVKKVEGRTIWLSSL